LRKSKILDTQTEIKQTYDENDINQLELEHSNMMKDT